MIEFNNLCRKEPYIKFKNFYDLALTHNQKNIEAICISSFSKDLEEVNSRLVNLKIINCDDFIFFSNYNSPKANEFFSHSQISIVIFWQTINTQIRMKAKIKKLKTNQNKVYFKSRCPKKNALAISSQQSLRIDSYESVLKRYEKSLNSNNLDDCPDYWGGFSFTPYYFEFWKGNDSRINHREVYEKNKANEWEQYFIQP